jgi:hypothetical protein
MIQHWWQPQLEENRRLLKGCLTVVQTQIYIFKVRTQFALSSKVCVTGMNVRWPVWDPVAGSLNGRRNRDCETASWKLCRP